MPGVEGGGGGENRVGKKKEGVFRGEEKAAAPQNANCRGSARGYLAHEMQKQLGLEQEEEEEDDNGDDTPLGKEQKQNEEEEEEGNQIRDNGS